MLEGVVTEGTAKNLNNSIYKIAGKTGTAQIANNNKGYSNNAYHNDMGSGVSYQASFVGYFPADDPKYSCIVVVNSPSNSVYYGNVIAGPVFKEIADKVYANTFDIQSTIKATGNMADVPYSKTGLRKDLDYIFDKLDIPVDTKDTKAEWVSTMKKNNKIEYNSRHIINKLVPNVVDMGLRDAIFLLENAGLRVIVKGRGKVTNQSIAHGTIVSSGATIILDMSLGLTT